MSEEVDSIEHDSIQTLQEIAYKNAEELKMQASKQNEEDSKINEPNGVNGSEEKADDEDKNEDSKNDEPVMETDEPVLNESKEKNGECIVENNDEKEDSIEELAGFPKEDEEPVPKSSDGEVEVEKKSDVVVTDKETKPTDKNETADQKQDNEDEDEDDDFNPLLFCPEVSMDVDESPVITTSDAENAVIDDNSLFTPLFSTYVDEVTGAEVSFNLTNEENVLRERLYGQNSLPIQKAKVHCTACNIHLGSALIAQNNRFVHPLLKVLICKECYHFYTSGEFEKDEDGSELYCRWCGQGGQVLCCSKCEYVFCKKCIRINFGRKKLIQVRDSEEWNCFRCDMAQIQLQRVQCFEFFEYIKREMGQVSALEDPEYMKRDFTSCCSSNTKKRPEPEGEDASERRSVKRKKTQDVDPDYDPHVEKDESAAPPGAKVAAAADRNVRVNVPILPKPCAASPNVKLIPTPQNPIRTVIGGLVRAQSVQAIRTSSTVGGKPQTFLVRPQVPNRVMGVRPNTSSPQLRQAITAPSTSVRPTMKHEWFEKTVRAAARVNSNLSYTLTQLNKAQATAGSVEQLAVVHNKLQEVLSSSINSLIQIRKNLRTEFIAGIKNIRFPVAPKPKVDPNDDDCIIVTPMSKNAPKPSPAKPAPARAAPPLARITPSPTKVPPAPIKNKETPQVSVKTTTSTPNKSISVNGGGYLKVRSFSQLQTLTPECITIPDDEPKFPQKEDCVMFPPQENNIQEKDPLADSDEEMSSEKKDDAKEENEKNGDEKDAEGVKVKEEPKDVAINTKESNESPVIRRMLSVKVNLKKSALVEDMVKKEPIEAAD